jgi:hypothetical protein
MGWIEISLVVVVLLGLFVWYGKHTNEYAKRMAKIGVAAAQTYVLSGQQDALIAAKTVKAGMAQAHIQQLMMFMNQIPTSDTQMEREELYKQRHEKLMSELFVAKTGVAAATEFRKELDAMKSNWLPAIIKCDVALADKASMDAMVASLGKK